MTSLTAANTFDDVYQLETTDPVTGGPGGVANRQAQALLNRTAFLQNLISQAATLASFASSKASSGYQKLPSGLILQWGLVTPTVAGVTVVIPIAFPNAMLVALATKGTQSNNWVSTANYTLTSFNMYSQAAEGNPSPWIAIGF